MRKIYLIPFFLFSFLVMFFVKSLFLNPSNIPSSLIGKSLPKFPIISLYGQGEHKIFMLNEVFNNNHSWFLINVWASWCESCLEEQRFLLELSKHNIVIHGLNYKDSISAARNWLNEWGNPYRFNGFDDLGKVALELGVYGTPETFLVDKKGIIRYRFAGTLDDSIWNQYFVPLIKKIESEV